MKIISTHEELEKALPKIIYNTRLAIDTETNGLDPHSNDILLFQIGTGQEDYIFDCARLGGAMYTLVEAINSPKILKVMHNAKFDYSMIKTNYGIDLQNIACTLVGAQLLTKGLMGVDNSLAGCLDKYLGIKIDKEEQMSFVDLPFGFVFTKEQLVYAAEDTKHLLKLYDKIQEKLDARGMKTLSELEYETCRVCGDLEVNGIYIDKKKWLDLRNLAAAECVKYREKLDAILVEHNYSLDMFGNPEVNYNSPSQMLPTIKKITGDYSISSTDSKELERVDHPFVESLLKYKKAMKLYSTYGEEFLEKNINKTTNKLHSNFKQLGTDSGRMSSSQPNLQNIPATEEYRAPFKVEDEENYRMICADFSGQELRLLAQISKEPKFIEALVNNMDLHSYSASLLYDIPYNDFFEKDEEGNILMDKGEPVVKPEMKKKYRNPCKSITFGL
jgi:DNA polymerase-1